MLHEIVRFFLYSFDRIVWLLSNHGLYIADHASAVDAVCLSVLPVPQAQSAAAQASERSMQRK